METFDQTQCLCTEPEGSTARNKSKNGIKADHDLEWKMNGVGHVDWCILGNEEPFVIRYQPVD